MKTQDNAKTREMKTQDKTKTREMIKAWAKEARVKLFMAKFGKDDYETFWDISEETAENMMKKCFDNKIDFSIDFNHNEEEEI